MREDNFEERAKLIHEIAETGHFDIAIQCLESIQNPEERKQIAQHALGCMSLFYVIRTFSAVRAVEDRAAVLEARKALPDISAYQTIYKAPDGTMEGIDDLIDLLPDNPLKLFWQELGGRESTPN